MLLFFCESLQSQSVILVSRIASWYENILIPGGLQERYHHIIEEAYVALGLIETQVDELKAELEYQHQRLDETRDAALAEIIHG